MYATPSDGDDIFHGLKYSMCTARSWMMHAELAMEVGDNYCPKEHLLDASVMDRHNMMPLGPARILKHIPEGPTHGMKCACHDSNDNTMSIASGNNLVSAGSQYTNSVDSPAMLSSQAWQHQQA
eukprot:4639796-Ditylum_brightwellii.AAC.1